MKLVTFSHSGSTRIALVDGEEVVDLPAAAPELPRDMLAFLGCGSSSTASARSRTPSSTNPTTPRDESILRRTETALGTLWGRVAAPA